MTVQRFFFTFGFQVILPQNLGETSTSIRPSKFRQINVTGDEKFDSASSPRSTQIRTEQPEVEIELHGEVKFEVRIDVESICQGMPERATESGDAGFSLTHRSQVPAAELGFRFASISFGNFLLNASEVVAHAARRPLAAGTCWPLIAESFQRNPTPQ